MTNNIVETLKSLLLAYLLTIILLFLLALSVYLWNLSGSLANILIVCIYIITCFIGGLRLGKKVGTKRFLWGMLLGGSYCGILLLLSLALNKGVDPTSMANLSSLALCLGGGTLGGMVS